jgi:hypothetical protein
MTDPSLARTRSSSELDELVLSSDRASSPACLTSSSDMVGVEEGERRRVRRSERSVGGVRVVAE